MEKTIYPLIRTEENQGCYLLETNVRKQFNDKYYLFRITKKILFDVAEEEKAEKIIKGIKQVNIDTYRFLIKGELSDLLELDENQESEEERLMAC